MSLTPNFEGEIVYPGSEVHVRINSLGLRGPEPLPTPEGPRWLVIGDSFVLSLQVPKEQTFEHLLAQRLGVEVFNGGVSGDSTWQSVTRYDMWDDTLQTDTVILLFFLGNDLLDNATFDPSQMDRWHIGPTVQRSTHPPPSPLVRFLAGHSYLFAHIRVAAQRKAVKGTERMANWRKELAIYTRSGRPQLDTYLPFTARAFERFDERARLVRRDRYVVALAPPGIAVNPERMANTLEFAGFDPAEADPDAPRQAVADLLADQQIPTCDLTPALREAEQAGVPTYLVYDGHWSPEGHEVVAQALQRCITEASP